MSSDGSAFPLVLNLHAYPCVMASEVEKILVLESRSFI